MNVGSVFLDLIFPRRCVSCGEDTDDSFLCASCREALPIREQDGCCHLCGKRFLEDERIEGAEKGGDLICSGCRHRPPAYDLARSAVSFHGPMRALVHQLKYGRSDWLATPLALFLEGAVHAFYDRETPDCIVPIPLHPAREFKRRFNQADRLAVALSRRIGVPVASSVVERAVNTATQTKKTAVERRESMKGAFRVVEGKEANLFGKCVLLVDDVMTTGSTFHEAARVLREAGAARILCLSLARD